VVLVAVKLGPEMARVSRVKVPEKTDAKFKWNCEISVISCDILISV
jgi:hypothetical protein